MAESTTTAVWHKTACVICSLNCGLEIQVDDGHIKKIRGDKAHPISQGYVCQKAARLEHYQHHGQRLTEPLRRRADGSYEPIDWETAIGEVSQKLIALREAHGNHVFAYYGGGGQGNHMCGMYGGTLRAALGTPYFYSSLAQEKTGDFWINGKLFGRQTCHVSEDIEESDYVMIIGTNPWQSHGIQRARAVLRELSKDPDRTLVVIDPRRTRTAELADIHLQVKPGMDAFLLTAMLGHMVQEDLVDHDFLQQRTHGYDELRDLLQTVDVDDYAVRSGVDADLVRQVAHGFATARRACTRHDLGVEQSLHSTLNCYLEKLLFLLTGNFGVPGGNNLHTSFMPIMGHSKEPEDGGLTTKVTGMKEISKLFPPNILPAEIDTDHPERLRALIVDSSNPMQSAADTPAMRRAFEKLELLVVIDVARTETAMMADYVLPAHTQYEKWESAFFNFGFPVNHFNLRKPIFEPQGNTLPEPEIYRRLLVAMDELPDRFPELEAKAREHLENPEAGILPQALQETLKAQPHWGKYAPAVLYSTLGKALPGGAQNAAALWDTAHFYAQRYPEQVRRTGLEGEGPALGKALFQRILTSESGVILSIHEYDEVWELVRHADQKVRLCVPEMAEEIRALATEAESHAHAKYPWVLAVGERRSYNANQLMRTPAWRQNDPDGALRIHPDDAAGVGLDDGDMAVCASESGAVTVRVAYDDAMRPGFLARPHGYGMTYPDPEQPDRMLQYGPYANLLTSSSHCDALAKTPFHKYVPVQLRPLPTTTTSQGA